MIISLSLRVGTSVHHSMSLLQHCCKASNPLHIDGVVQLILAPPCIAMHPAFVTD